MTTSSSAIAARMQIFVTAMGLASCVAMMRPRCSAMAMVKKGMMLTAMQAMR